MFGSMVSRSAKHAALTRYVDRSPSPHLLAHVVAKSAAKLPGKVDVKNMVNLSKPDLPVVTMDIETYQQGYGNWPQLDPLKLWPVLAGNNQQRAVTNFAEQEVRAVADSSWLNLRAAIIAGRGVYEAPAPVFNVEGTITGRFSGAATNTSNTPSAAYKPTHGGYPDARKS